MAPEANYHDGGLRFGRELLQVAKFKFLIIKTPVQLKKQVQKAAAGASWLFGWHSARAPAVDHLPDTKNYKNTHLHQEPRLSNTGCT